jgi:hypothetical protein
MAGAPSAEALTHPTINARCSFVDILCENVE